MDTHHFMGKGNRACGRKRVVCWVGITGARSHFYHFYPVPTSTSDIDSWNRLDNGPKHPLWVGAIYNVHLMFQNEGS